MPIWYQFGQGKYAETYIVNRTATCYTTNNNNNLTILHDKGFSFERNCELPRWESDKLKYFSVTILYVSQDTINTIV